MVVNLKVVYFNVIGVGRFWEILSFSKFTYVWAISSKKGGSSNEENRVVGRMVDGYSLNFLNPNLLDEYFAPFLNCFTSS